MRVAQVEIYSDAANAAILRHPGRRFPGVLMQGDTLHRMLRTVAGIIAAAPDSLTEDARDELADLYDELHALVTHYERTLDQHGIELPYAE